MGKDSSSGSKCDYSTRGKGFKLKEKSFRYQEDILYCEIGEAVEQAAQQGCRCPVPGSIQGQAVWGLEQPGIEGGGPVSSKGFGTR